MTATAYQNELEQQFGRLPGFLQDVLRDPFNWVDGVLKDIAGQPQQLVAAGEQYAALGQQIAQLGAEQAQDRQSILNGAWDGRAYQAFSAQMAQVEQRVAALGRSTAQTQQLLDSAAQACTQSADAIVSIVEGFISFALQDAIVSGVTSLITFGGAAAAGAALAVAKFADACEEIGGIVARLTTVLQKIALMLADLSRVCEKAATFMKDLQLSLKTMKLAKKDMTWVQGLKAEFGTAKGLATFGKKTAIVTGVQTAAGLAVDKGTFPGLGSGIAHAADDGYNAVKDDRKAEEQK